jgi:chorismate--pyruvate lyase
MSVFDARWMPHSQLRYACADRSLYGWLSDNSSLTQRLIEHCSGKFEVRVRGQRWKAPLLSESRLLGLRAGEYAMVREVELLCNGIPHVYARTLIPKSSLTGRASHLQGLGSKPLGALLFSDPTTRRSVVEYARLLASHRLYQWAMSSMREIDREMERELWGRRTLFCYAGKPLLVNEIFLPAICEYKQR